MPSPERAHLPFASLLGVQVRSVGLAILREGALAVGGLAAICLLSTVTAIRYRERIEIMPELLLPALLVGALLPWAVWKGDPVFGRALLWSLPVRRQHAALAKVASGALWLMLAILAAFLLLAAMGVATGASVGVEEMRLVQASRDLETARSVRWVTPPWMWLAPFGGALTFYVASSALLLGVRHPVRWLAGLGVTAALLAVLIVNLGPGSGIGRGFERLLQTLWSGTWGLDFALTGGAAALVEDVRRPDGGSVDVWTALPEAGRWAAAFAVWLGGALLALALALRRHWER